jgi:hypothetical protein
MAEHAQDQKSPKAEAEKKVPETVLLTAEELRAIAGGAAGVSVPPGSQPKVIIAGQPKQPGH